MRISICKSRCTLSSHYSKFTVIPSRCFYAADKNKKPIWILHVLLFHLTTCQKSKIPKLMPFLFEIVLNHSEGSAYVTIAVEYGELNSIVSAEQQKQFFFLLLWGNFHVSYIYICHFIIA